MAYSDPPTDSQKSRVLHELNKAGHDVENIWDVFDLLNNGEVSEMISDLFKGNHQIVFNQLLHLKTK